MADRERRHLLLAHQEWLGFVQPVGLVVSPPVMVDAQVVPDRNAAGRQRELRALLDEDGHGIAARPRAPGPRSIFIDFLGWEEGDLLDAAGHRDALEIALPELQVVLSPTWAVPAEQDTDAASTTAWTMLVRVEDDGADLDRPPEGTGWNATRHARFERLLRETGVSTGLLCTDERIRLVYAPKGESSGHITFDLSQMALPAGRPILAAFDMLLSAAALFGSAPEARLPALLARSRDAQAEVSTRLSRQVLAALHELLRGFVTAGARDGGKTAALARSDPEHLYGGLITTLMRLVFVLYAEDRGLMPDHPVYQQHYSLGGLFARLRADAAAWPDTMDQRFGAWARLLSLFRLIYGGGRHAGLSFVARKGTLFDPDRFPFLEGRPWRERQAQERITGVPRDKRTPATREASVSGSVSGTPDLGSVIYDIPEASGPPGVRDAGASYAFDAGVTGFTPPPPPPPHPVSGRAAPPWSRFPNPLLRFPKGRRPAEPRRFRWSRTRPSGRYCGR